MRLLRWCLLAGRRDPWPISPILRPCIRRGRGIGRALLEQVLAGRVAPRACASTESLRNEKKQRAHLRRIAARTFTDMFQTIAEVCELYSSQECWNYCKAAGYVSS